MEQGAWALSSNHGPLLVPIVKRDKQRGRPAESLDLVFGKWWRTAL